MAMSTKKFARECTAYRTKASPPNNFYKRYQYKRIHTNNPHSLPLETCLANNIIHTMSGLIWSKLPGKEYFNHLLKTLHEKYTVSTDWEGKRYPSMNLYWYSKHFEVHVSMLDYFTEALKRFKHNSLLKPQHQPHPHVLPTYGAKFQYSTNADSSLLIGKEGKKFIQEVTRNFLYYAISVYFLMLTALVSISNQQDNPKENTMKKLKLFFDYAATDPDDIVTFRASNMILALHSNK